MLSRLSLVNFRNYDKLSLSFFEGSHIFIGDNGMGKSNLLEAIYFLHQLKTFRAAENNDLVGKDGSSFYIKGKFIDDTLLSISYDRESNKKELLINDKPATIKSYTENNTCIFISNEDMLMATQAMSYRRREFDNIIGGISREYKVSLYEYTQILKKRNDLLKKGKRSDEMDHQLCVLGIKIMKARDKILTILRGDFKSIYHKLMNVHFDVDIVLGSELGELSLESYEIQMVNNHTLDMVTKKTNFGAHTQRIDFLFEKKDIKSIASQAQTKLFIYAFKLSTYSYCVNRQGKYPLLLLDDVFADLDPSRIEQFFDYLKGNKQLFLTCANSDLVRPYVGKAHFYNINHGKIKYNEG